MKPILYDETTQTLAQIAASYTNGVGLINALTAVVTEERNGLYELEMNVFIEDELFSAIHPGSIFKVKAGDKEGMQLFRVYQITKPLNGVCTVYARHITYDLGKAPVLPFTAVGVSNALNGLVSHLATQYEFGVFTDIQNTETGFTLEEPKYFRECLGGYAGSILDCFGGEYEFDNLTVKLLAHRGNNNGVEIRYGKNLIDVTQETNIDSMYDAVLGFAVAGDGTVTNGTIQYITPNTSAPKTMIIDFSDQFDDDTPITVNAINTLSQNYIQAHSLNVPKVSIDVSLIALQQTDQYKDVLQLERVSLCDTVQVYFEKLGVNATAKVIRTEYDVLNERLTNVEIGDARTNLTESIVDSVSDEVVTEAVSAMDGAIEHATDLITGGLGGYVVISKNANGQPEEILIMDTADKQTAVNVIRMNKNGIGFSNTGYSGTYTTAWTIDGGFVADFIQSGTINAIDITGSNITGSRIVFGDSPNTTELRTNDQSTGALFEGTGVMQFETKGEFRANNLDSSDYEANHLLLTNTGTESSAEMYNYFNNVRTNDVDLTSKANENKLWLENNFTGLDVNANSLSLNSTASSSSANIRNFDYGRSGTLANRLMFTSHSDGNLIWLLNYDSTETRKNYLYFQTNSTDNQIWLSNTSKSGKIQMVKMTDNGLELYSNNTIKINTDKLQVTTTAGTMTGQTGEWDGRYYRFLFRDGIMVQVTHV